VPEIYDASLADQNVEISTERRNDMARQLAREHGLLVGVSAAAAVVGSCEIAGELKKNQPATMSRCCVIPATNI